ncbi:hypothetical protein [Rhizobium rosettiformans]|uniref:hypothetical protein n=1 Tax=Rhizobium rosettiformans TaxID=1368430 RepID=UPI0028602D6B|nr:hypothetical protein [Rhizobium rosettiformans]MDR7027234.1 hypothetical protein [Rhizobium rosettiformans]MDR7065355.1 hypothetical protein [Rhizobium rosettiformans]
MKLVTATAFALSLLVSSPSMAEDIDQLPLAATFVISGGYWESGPEGVPGVETAVEAGERGYYKLIAIRQPDRTARIHLQMVASGEAGLRLVESVELEEFAAIKPYVTGIRPESTSGVAATPGFFATVYLRTAPDSDRIEEWTVLIDELGDIRVERASN